MRIAQVSHSLDCGGSMALVVALSGELAKRGHQVDIICLDEPCGSAHETCWIAQLRRSRITIRFLGRKKGAPGVMAAVKLWWTVQRRKYDVLHSHLPMPDAISGLVRRSSPHRFVHVATVHNTHEPRSRTLQVLGSGANVVYCSEAVSTKNPLPNACSTTIPNGLPQLHNAMPARPRAEVRQEIGIECSATVVVAVSRLSSQKNLDAALAGFSVLKARHTAANLHFLICGDGEEKEMLQTRVKLLGLEAAVHFLGARTDVPSILAAADIFLSTSRHEGMPLSVLEALSDGLPCVLSAIREHHEVAESMPGCVFVSTAPDAIASGLESALPLVALRPVLRGQRALLLEKHSMDRCAQLYEHFYQAHRFSPGLNRERISSSNAS